jgi:hypothetical protein
LQRQASLKTTNGDLRLTTQAGLQNNQAVNQAIRLAEQDGEALAKKTPNFRADLCESG